MPIKPPREEPFPVRKTELAAFGLRSIAVFRVLIVAAGAFIWLCGSSILVDEVQGGGPPTVTSTYVYDGLGRLIAVINGSGNAATYQYDNVGNLLSISLTTSATVSVFGLSPNNGPVGTRLTIYGDGFSTVATQNTVTIGGVQASISSSTQTAISAMVPTGLAIGTATLTVTAPAGSASTHFTVTQN
jgi:YD repeat-containing protein